MFTRTLAFCEGEWALVMQTICVLLADWTMHGDCAIVTVICEVSLLERKENVND